MSEVYSLFAELTMESIRDILRLLPRPLPRRALVSRWDLILYCRSLDDPRLNEIFEHVRNLFTVSTSQPYDPLGYTEEDLRTVFRGVSTKDAISLLKEFDIELDWKDIYWRDLFFEHVMNLDPGILHLLVIRVQGWKRNLHKVQRLAKQSNSFSNMRTLKSNKRVYSQYETGFPNPVYNSDQFGGLKLSNAHTTSNAFIQQAVCPSYHYSYAGPSRLDQPGTSGIQSSTSYHFLSDASHNTGIYPLAGPSKIRI